MKRKMLALILAIALISTIFVGCNNGEVAEVSTPKTPTSETEVPVSDAETSVEISDAVSYLDDKTDVSVLAGLKIGYAQRNTNGAWLIAQTEDFEAVSKELGIDFRMTDSDDDQAKQISDVEDLCSQGIDVLMYPAIEFEAGASALKIAKNAGIPVFLVGNDVKKNDDDFVTAALNDYIVDGGVCGKWLAENYDGKELKIVEIAGIEGSDPQIGRAQGFRDAIAGQSGFEIIASQNGDFLMDQAQDVMDNLLQSSIGAEIDVVFCHTDEMAIGAVSAIEAAGKQPGIDIIVLGVDGQKAAVDLIKEGKINAVSTCNTASAQYIYNYIAKYLNGETVDKIYNIPSYIIDSTNCNENPGF